MPKIKKSSFASQTPKNIEDLKQTHINILRSGEQKRFGLRSLHILKSMLDAPNEAAVSTISEIAKKNNTNSSTVTRLARRLGFEGFLEFQDLFRKPLLERTGFYSTQVEKFLQTARAEDTPEASMLRQVVQDEWGNVMMMLENYSPDQFEKAAGLLVTARRVFTIGLRGSYPLAFFLAHYLKMIRDDVTVLGSPGHTLAEDLVELESQDLLFAISVKPYTRETITACQVAREKKAAIVAMTDNQSSPLAAESDTTLHISAKEKNFFSPITSGIIYIEALLSEVVRLLEQKALRKLEEAERLLGQLGIETK